MLAQYNVNELAARAKNERDKLILQYLYLPRAIIARKFNKHNEDEKDELESVGFEALVRAADKYDPSRGDFRYYAWVTIYHTILRWVEMEKRHQHQQLNNKMVDGDPPDERVIRKMIAEDLYETIQDSELTEQQMDYTIRRLYQGESTVAIAEEMGVSPANVSQVMRKIKKKVRRKWNK